MDVSKEEQQRQEFRAILFELAANQEMFQDTHTCLKMYRRLEKLYYSPDKEKHFRHFYSDIFTVLTQIQQDPSRGDINILGQNLSLIRAGYKAEVYDEQGIPIDISDSIRKLYDHVSLDIARILYSDAGDRETSGKDAISKIQAQIKQINMEVEKAATAQQEVEEEIVKQQKEYIAILGIFAAVVLAFTGGIAFSTSVLENINSVSSYRIIVMALIIGLVLINVFFGLFYYVDRLVNGKETGKIKPLWISNLIIVILLAGTIFAWYFGCVERRDSRIDTNIQIYRTVEGE